MKCKKCGAETKEGSKFAWSVVQKLRKQKRIILVEKGVQRQRIMMKRKMVIRYWKNRKDNNRSIISYFCDHVNRCFLWGF